MLKILFLAVAALMTGCSTVQTANVVAVSEVVSANLTRPDGSSAGVAILSQRTDGLWLSVSADAPGVGIFGMHIHAVGRCDGPDFATAGPHWNPATKQHGRDNPMGSHAGDMPNLTANADGKLVIETKLGIAALSGADAVLDNDGASIIIHEKPDDYKTDPSGNSGKRIICGVFKSGG
jgi:superoxide dismutase, Cu-Zn family